MHSSNITRRAAFIGAGASLAAIAAAAVPAVGGDGGEVCSFPVDAETDGLVGLPLAAVHIERAIAAMGDVTFGKWEVTIRSGEPNQNWGFHQIGPKRRAEVKNLTTELQAVLESDGTAWNVLIDRETGVVALLRRSPTA